MNTYTFILTVQETLNTIHTTTGQRVISCTMGQLQAILCWLTGWLGLILYVPYLPQTGSFKTSFEINASPSRRLSGSRATTNADVKKLPVYVSAVKLLKRKKLPVPPIQVVTYVMKNLNYQKTSSNHFVKPPNLPVQVTARKVIHGDNKIPKLNLHVSARKIPSSALNRRFRMAKAIKNSRNKQHDLSIGQNWGLSYEKANIQVNIRKGDIKIRSSNTPGIIIAVINVLVKVVLTVISWFL